MHEHVHTPSVCLFSPLSPCHSSFSDGIARSTASLLSELRSAVFAKVAQAGIRVVARETFAHLHSLDLKFHLNRNTGALSRSIDRGVRYAPRVWVGWAGREHLGSCG